METTEFTLTPEMAGPLRDAAKSLRRQAKSDPLQAEAFSDEETGKSAVEQAAAKELRHFIERIERLEEEKKTLSDDIADVIGEAKGRGYDTKAIRTIVRLRKKDTNERLEEETILHTYMAALGME